MWLTEWRRDGSTERQTIASIALSTLLLRCKSKRMVRRFCYDTWTPFCHHFLPCDGMRCTVFVILSVRPSVTLVDCVHMVRPTIMISSPYGSPVILVSGDITFTPKFEGGHPERGRWMRAGWVRIGDFRPISRRISETVRDTTKVILLKNVKNLNSLKLGVRTTWWTRTTKTAKIF